MSEDYKYRIRERGSHRLDPRSHIPALIDAKVLEAAFASSGFLLGSSPSYLSRKCLVLSFAQAIDCVACRVVISWKPEYYSYQKMIDVGLSTSIDQVGAFIDDISRS